MLKKLKKFLNNLLPKKKRKTSKNAFPCTLRTKPDEKICVICGKPFQTLHGRKITCSPECRRKYKHELRKNLRAEKHVELSEKTCELCGKTFQPKRNTQKYCSPECYHQYSRKKSPEKSQEKAAATLQKKTCPGCGVTFTTHNTQKKYCSYKCSQKHFRQTHKGKIAKKCFYCGEKFYSESETQNYCSEDCQNAAIRNAGFTPSKKKQKKSLGEWQKEATLCGMTYGQYRIAIEKNGKTFDELKLPEMPAPVEKILFECTI